MALNVLSWIAMICSIGGNLGVIYKKLWGMQAWTIGSLMWIVYAVIKKDYAQTIMFFAYFALNIMGWIKWRQDHDKEEIMNVRH